MCQSHLLLYELPTTAPLMYVSDAISARVGLLANGLHISRAGRWIYSSRDKESFVICNFGDPACHCYNGYLLRIRASQPESSAERGALDVSKW